MNVSGKNRGRLQYLLNDWYGHKRGSLEIIPHLQDCVPLNSAAQEIISVLRTPEEIKMMELKEQWEKIAGKQIAKISTPLNIKCQVIYIEVNHTVWLRELNKDVKKILIEKINDLFKENFCQDIKFVPVGRRY